MDFLGAITPEQFGQIVSLLIAAGAGFATKHHLVRKASLDKVTTYASFAAQAAEEMYHDDLSPQGQAKLQYVLGRLGAKYNIDVDEAEQFALAAVMGLRASGLKGLPQRQSDPRES